MRGIFLSVFILSLFFINSAVAAGWSDLGNALVRTGKRLLLPKTSEEMVESLERLEEVVWGKSLGEFSESDIKQLIDSEFDPEKLIKDIKGFRREATPLGLERTWDPDIELNVFIRIVMRMLGYIRSPIFLRWWSQANFRKYTFLYIQKRNLAENPELLLRWWEEAKASGNEKMLEFYMRSSFKEVVDVFPPNEIMNSLHIDPLLDTVFRTMNETDTFSDDMKPVLERLYKEFGINPGRGVGAVSTEWS